VTSKVIFLFGVTGSGKTSRALGYAREQAALGVRVEIVNADSRQIYKGLPVLSACPTAAEYAEFPHHLFEFLALDEPYSAGRYGREARAVVDDIVARGAVPLVVGGTGFYFTALEGLPEVPAVPVAELKARYGHMSVDALAARVREVDPDWWTAANDSERRNPQRMMRVLGVAEVTGTLMSGYGATRGDFREVYEVEQWVMMREREELKARLRERVDAGFEAMKAEVAAVMARGLTDDAPGLQTLGFADLAACVRGEITDEDAKALLLKGHVGYAKRQETWGRKL